MAYTRENFEEWIILIPFKMEYFTDLFAKENNLKDVSVDIPLRKDGMCNRSIRLTENHHLHLIQYMQKDKEDI